MVAASNCFSRMEDQGLAPFNGGRPRKFCRSACRSHSLAAASGFFFSRGERTQAARLCLRVRIASQGFHTMGRRKASLDLQDPEKAGLGPNIHLEPRSKSRRTLVLRVLGRPRHRLCFFILCKRKGTPVGPEVHRSAAQTCGPWDRGPRSRRICQVLRRRILREAASWIGPASCATGNDPAVLRSTACSNDGNSWPSNHKKGNLQSGIVLKWSTQNHVRNRKAAAPISPC